MSTQRRAAVVTAFAVLVLLLVQEVRRQVPAVDAVLEDILGPAVDRMPLAAGFATALMVVGVAAAAATAAMLAGRRAPGLLAIMTASVLTWLVFPFARLDWLALFLGAPISEATPSPATWAITAALVLLAAVEAIASTREELIDDLRRRRVPDDDLAAVARRSSVVAGAIGAAALVLALPAALAAAGAFGDIAPDLRVDLVLLPAAIGLAIGAYVYWAARPGTG